jgi:Lrp/AsnC family leucine-responsive transcriptional regulator
MLCFSEANFQLDEKSWLLLQALQEDGRAPLKVLAAKVGLSIPSATERLRRLQEAGVVRNIVAQVDPGRVGYGVQAVVGITVFQPGKKQLLDKLRQLPQVIECHHVAGVDSYLMMVVARNLADLEQFLGSINMFGETRTSIVFSTPIPRRGLQPPSAP